MNTRLEEWKIHLKTTNPITRNGLREDRISRCDFAAHYLTESDSSKTRWALLASVLETFTSEENRNRYGLAEALYGGIWKADKNEIDAILDFIIDGEGLDTKEDCEKC